METKNFDWGSFFMGILFVLVALLSFRNPLSSLVAIVAVFAIFAILKGLFELFFRNRMKELTGYRGTMTLVLGVLDIIIGVFLFFNMNAGVAALPFVFAIWFIVDSVFGLFNLDLARHVSSGYYWFSLIINVLGIILGFMMLFDPITSALTLSFLVGFYFMMYGITHIIYAFR